MNDKCDYILIYQFAKEIDNYNREIRRINNFMSVFYPFHAFNTARRNLERDIIHAFNLSLQFDQELFKSTCKFIISISKSNNIKIYFNEAISELYKSNSDIIDIIEYINKNESNYDIVDT